MAACACIAWLIYADDFRASEGEVDGVAIRNIFSTNPTPESYNLVRNFCIEAFDTFVFLTGILCIAAHAGDDLLGLGIGVGLLVWAVGMGLGGVTGFAMNQARDLGPRIAYQLLPIRGKVDNNWLYGLVVRRAARHPSNGAQGAPVRYGTPPWHPAPMGRIATSLKPRRIEDAMNAPKRYWNGLDDASRKAVKKASFAGLILGIVLIGITCIPSAIADVATDLILMAFGHAQNASLLSNFRKALDSPADGARYPRSLGPLLLVELFRIGLTFCTIEPHTIYIFPAKSNA